MRPGDDLTEDIRQEMEEDRPQVYRLLCEAFGRKDEAELVEALRRHDDFIPELSIVAAEDDGVRGHILFTPLSIEDKAGARAFPALALAPLAVLPDYQRQGIGSTLMEAGIEECRRLGHGLVIVVGYPNFYGRFGFMPARPHGIDTALKVGDQYFMVLELEEGVLSQVEGVVRYLPPFDELG